MAWIFFADERKTLGRPLFVGGLVAAVVGVYLTIPIRGETALWPGLPAMLLSSLSWAVLGALESSCPTPR